MFTHTYLLQFDETHTSNAGTELTENLCPSSAITSDLTGGNLEGIPTGVTGDSNREIHRHAIVVWDWN